MTLDHTAREWQHKPSGAAHIPETHFATISSFCALSGPVSPPVTLRSPKTQISWGSGSEADGLRASLTGLEAPPAGPPAAVPPASLPAGRRLLRKLRLPGLSLCHHRELSQLERVAVVGVWGLPGTCHVGGIWSGFFYQLSLKQRMG